VAFTLGAFGMIGVPPLAGFTTKWIMGTGALAVGMDWVVVVLVVSSLLNAAYFLPILHRIWFGERQAAWPQERRWGRLETSAWLLWPALITAVLLILAGLLANLPVSPLSWVELIVAREVAL